MEVPVAITVIAEFTQLELGAKITNQSKTNTIVQLIVISVENGVISRDIARNGFAKRRSFIIYRILHQRKIVSTKILCTVLQYIALERQEN